MADQLSSWKQHRRADQALQTNYHEARLADLLEHVRAGFAAYDAGRIDAFGLNDVVDHHRRAARALWKFCAVSGAQVEAAARPLAYLKERGQEPDWWRAAERPGR